MSNAEEDDDKETKMVNCFVAENGYIYLVTMYNIIVLDEDMSYNQKLNLNSIYEKVDRNISYISCCQEDIGIENNHSYLIGCKSHDEKD